MPTKIQLDVRVEKDEMQRIAEARDLFQRAPTRDKAIVTFTIGREIGYVPDDIPRALVEHPDELRHLRNAVRIQEMAAEHA